MDLSRFEATVSATLAQLQASVGFDLWMMTRVEGDDWIVLAAEDAGYGVVAGKVFAWDDSFCSRMVRGEGPTEAPDSAKVPAYASAPIAAQVPIGAYVGLPVYCADGTLFGTLCAIQPERREKLTDAQRELLECATRLVEALLASEFENQRLGRLVERLDKAATRDTLTGLLNRRGWDRVVQAEEERCRRLGGSATVAVLDLDELKHVNDAHGHDAGDTLLREAAAVLLAAAGPGSIVARLGGDEFAVLLPESRATADATLERIRRQLRAARVPASLGAARRRPDADLATACREADGAMYAHKRQRRTRSIRETVEVAEERCGVVC